MYSKLQQPYVNFKKIVFLFYVVFRVSIFFFMLFNITVMCNTYATVIFVT